MRIIAGQFSGRRLIAPEGQTTRPITDRVKQSLFDIVNDRLDGAEVYDVFAGTGSLGLESLSRGAKHVTFFEADRSALARLSQNIMALRIAERTRTIPGDLFKWFERASIRTEDAGRIGADVIFLDPPYRFVNDRPDELLQLALHLNAIHLKPGGVLIFRHDSQHHLELPLAKVDEREYGSQLLEFYNPGSGQ
jgi:16S rRNA (guanine966-N2)-methyltransferase